MSLRFRKDGFILGASDTTRIVEYATDRRMDNISEQCPESRLVCNMTEELKGFSRKFGVKMLHVFGTKAEEARNTPFCPSQEKFHTVVLRGVRNSAEAPQNPPMIFLL